jgi:hypothetical protein
LHIFCHDDIENNNEYRKFVFYPDNSICNLHLVYLIITVLKWIPIKSYAIQISVLAMYLTLEYKDSISLLWTYFDFKAKLE